MAFASTGVNRKSWMLKFDEVMSIRERANLSLCFGYFSNCKNGGLVSAEVNLSGEERGLS